MTQVFIIKNDKESISLYHQRCYSINKMKNILNQSFACEPMGFKVSFKNNFDKNWEKQRITTSEPDLKSQHNAYCFTRYLNTKIGKLNELYINFKYRNKSNEREDKREYIALSKYRRKK